MNYDERDDPFGGLHPDDDPDGYVSFEAREMEQARKAALTPDERDRDFDENDCGPRDPRVAAAIENLRDAMRNFDEVAEEQLADDEADEAEMDPEERARRATANLAARLLELDIDDEEFEAKSLPSDRSTMTPTQRAEQRKITRAVENVRDFEDAGSGYDYAD